MMIINKYLHINGLNRVLAILANNMRERKALFQTVDEHGVVSLIQTGPGVFILKFYLHFLEQECKEDGECCACDDEDGESVDSIGDARSDRRQRIENRGRSVTKISDISAMR